MTEQRFVWLGKSGRKTHFFRWESDIEALCGVVNGCGFEPHKSKVFRCKNCLKLHKRYRK